MLGRLDYRGYDSWGIATEEETIKDTGQVPEEELDLSGDLGCSHTRWATTGDVTKENAHPHESCERRYAIVHNGIITNYEDIKDRLKNKAHEFTSETDSEVISHLVEEYDGGGHPADVYSAIDTALKAIEGNNAFVVLDRANETIYAARDGSPLVLGFGEESTYVASDLYAFSPYTNKAYFLEDGDIAVLENGGTTVNMRELGDMGGIEEIEWTQEEKQLEDYDHWMRKEVDEIPDAIQDYLDSIIGDQAQNLNDIVDKIENSERVIFAASGSSYHAALLGVYYLQKAGIEAQALIASEFENYERVNKNTTVIAVSQSGETRDVLDAIQYSREREADIVSLVNVPHSTIQRESDLSLEIRAGQEICVAATKTFVNQLVSLMSIAQRAGYDIDLSELPEKIEREIGVAEEDAKRFANQHNNSEDIYVVGKGETYPIAREISLKLKEIAYNHSEGMMAGEFKHGTLALVEEGTPMIALNSENNDIESTVEEVSARGADVKKVESESDELLSIGASIYGFLLSYYLAKNAGNPIDRPRNLAKSVTTE